MNKRIVTGLLIAGALALTLQAQEPGGAGEHPSVVLGTFDSRAVAVAYVHSSGFQELMRAKHAELDRARADGDEAAVAELEAWGPALQERLHQQGFGTAPVDDILAGIAHELPALAAEAGVDVIVSKWALAYRAPAARTVDVTDRLAARFDPSADTLKAIRELVAQEPVPLEELKDHHD